VIVGQIDKSCRHFPFVPAGRNGTSSDLHKGRAQSELTRYMPVWMVSGKLYSQRRKQPAGPSAPGWLGGRHYLVLSMVIRLTLARAFSVFGNVTASRPFLNVAATLSSSI